MLNTYLPFFFAFIPAYFLISISPGLTMLTSMNIGLAYGMYQAIFFICGAVFGVALTAILSLTSAATIMIKAPIVFIVLKYLGAIILCYMGFIFLKNSKYMNNEARLIVTKSNKLSLAIKGFLTAIFNPKAWLLFIAFLPIFLRETLAIHVQILLIVMTIICIESLCMLAYAFSGNMAKKFIKTHNTRILHIVNGVIMFGLAFVLIAF